eukprot:TRINITY_DN40806_c0_g1_i1.p1 TRINITY_DN40806_c0_g1~~TRINITY_DN40806_c0_g1_i1.p1  ORF type:complete len:576 (-),score=94.10 TRINITY_DN40806_c0_g1_i1:24-1727(-)
MPLDYQQFIDLHGVQLVGSSVPEALWPMVHAKVTGGVLDAADYLQFAPDEEGSLVVAALRAIPRHSVVLLIDHAWTFKLTQARRLLAEDQRLLSRVIALMDMTVPQGGSPEQILDKAWETLWKCAQTYRIASESQLDTENVWYLMDELGSRFQHSESPNWATCPLLYVSEGVCYSLAWPIEDIDECELCTRDFLKGYEGFDREVRELVWFDKPELLAMLAEQLAALRAAHANPPPLALPAPGAPHRLPAVERIAVFTDSPLVRSALEDKRYFFVDSMSEAQIVWTDVQRSKYEEALQDHQFVNQFPNEDCLMAKNQLALTVREVFGYPPWLPVTYDLTTELALLVADYQERSEKGADNHWIVKPHRMARSMDAAVIKSIDCLIRVSETGPKVACKYIHDPFLYHGRKFDMRFIVVLGGSAPFHAFIYNAFWLRLSNRPYQLRDLDDYETHFTVMNYRPDSQFQQLMYWDFIPEFEAQAKTSWESVQARIDAMLRDALAAGVQRGMQDPRARAMYGADVMLGADLQPYLLELTYCPDCERAVKYHPTFFDDVFSTMFFDSPQNVRTLA